MQISEENISRVGELYENIIFFGSYLETILGYYNVKELGKNPNVNDEFIKARIEKLRDKMAISEDKARETYLSIIRESLP